MSGHSELYKRRLAVQGEVTALRALGCTLIEVSGCGTYITSYFDRHGKQHAEQPPASWQPWLDELRAEQGTVRLATLCQPRFRALDARGFAPAVALRVDRAGRGTLRNVAVASAGEAKGHGIWLDAVTLDQIAALLPGRPGRWTHGDLFGDQLGQHLGAWVNPRQSGEVLRADFNFDEAAHQIAPDGVKTSAADYLMGRAEERPEALGVSVVVGLDLEEGPEGRRLMRVNRVERADFVADPAANPKGLLGK